MDMGKGAPALRPAAGAARLKSEGEHMVNYLIKRTLFALLLVLVVATIVFGIVRLAPGDPAIVILGDAASQESIEALHEEMGLNQPLWRQYAVFMGNLAQLDLGDSMINGVPVLDQLEVALPYTLELTTAGMILGVVLGIPLGVICALYRNRIPDYLGRVLSLGGISIPSFYLSILLLYAFAVKCQWFPVVNLSTDGSIAARLYNLVLPMTTQGLIMTSFIMRMARSSLLNVLGEDYVRTARGKGLPERLVIFRHALINALIPVVAPQLSPFDPLAQDIHMRLHAPDGPFVLGTDDFGRDVLSRIFWGARISLTIGIGSVLFGMVLGSAMGMLAGLRGGRLGAFIMRCADTMMCFPAEILAILILVVLGQGVDKMLITIGLVMTPRFARLSYGSTLALREREFIEADLALGASTLYVLRQGILPNIMGELLVMSSLWAATAIRVEANLSFLGMGVSPPTPTWGNMVREGIEHLSTAPWLSFAPGLAIMATVLGLTLLGDGMRDVMDPKLQG